MSLKGDGQCDFARKAPCRVIGHNFLDNLVLVTRRAEDLGEDVMVSVEELQPGQMIKGEIDRTVRAVRTLGRFHLQHIRPLLFSHSVHHMLIGGSSDASFGILHLHEVFSEPSTIFGRPSHVLFGEDSLVKT